MELNKQSVAFYFLENKIYLYFSTYYHVTQRKNKESKYVKSNFVFLEDDNDQQMAIYNRN